MSAHKLYKLVGALHPEELGEVGKYLDSNVFNTNKRCCQLFQQLCRFHPTMESEKLTKERMSAKVFGKSTYDDGKMRKLMTQLSQLIERYLVIKMLDKSEDVHTQLLIKSLGERNDYDLFRVAAENRIATLERQQLRGKDYFRENHLLNEMLYYHPETEKLTKGNDYLQRAVLSFEQYFTLLSLENAADIMVINRLVGTKISIQYLEAVNDTAFKKDFELEPTIRFFHKLVRLHLGQEEAEDLEQLKDFALNSIKYLGRYEQSFAINSLRNFATPKLNTGSIPHTKFVFELIKFELENGLLILGENYLNSATFMNIVSTGLSIDELDWVKDFINKYNGMLAEEERQIAVDTCSGFWHYQNGIKTNNLEEFYIALKHYNMIPIRIGLKYDLRVRPSLLRTHFEIFERGKESLDDLLQQARNFERHIIANELYSESTKKMYLNFLKYYKSLARISSRPDRKVKLVQNFFASLQSEDTIALKGWLLKKGREIL